MPRFDPEPAYSHGSVARPGVLLVNLGTPDAPTPAALRKYLREFLSDPRVVEIPRAIWLPLLHGVILNTRPKQSAARYAAVWTPEGSPLKVHTERQARMLRGYLGERTRAPIEVQWAMRYGAPSITASLAALRARNCDRILLVPLYPQYSSSSTGSVMDATCRAIGRTRNVPALRVIKHFHDHPGYIAALVQSVRDHWMKTGRADHLVISFHGVPRYTLDKGDPYHCECYKTGRLLAETLALPEGRYSIAFQSRFGRAEWLKPYLAPLLAELGRKQVGRVDVVCPGFVCDCLETLEEIAIEGKATFLNAGGKEFHYIACLNERDDWLKALTDLVLENLQGWIVAAPPGSLERSRSLALERGAPD